jgi:hypothetical protein
MNLFMQRSLEIIGLKDYFKALVEIWDQEGELSDDVERNKLVNFGDLQSVKKQL